MILSGGPVWEHAYLDGWTVVPDLTDGAAVRAITTASAGWWPRRRRQATRANVAIRAVHAIRRSVPAGNGTHALYRRTPIRSSATANS